MPKAFRGRIAMFEEQELATLDQAAPVQNDWYTILDDTYARIYDWVIAVMTTDETLEVRATVDGEVTIGALAATFATDYRIIPHVDAQTTAKTLTIVADGAAERSRKPAYIIEGHDVLLEMRKTTVAGAGNHRAAVNWGKMIDVP